MLVLSRCCNLAHECGQKGERTSDECIPLCVVREVLRSVDALQRMYLK